MKPITLANIKLELNRPKIMLYYKIILSLLTLDNDNFKKGLQTVNLI